MRWEPPTVAVVIAVALLLFASPPVAWADDAGQDAGAASEEEAGGDASNDEPSDSEASDDAPDDQGDTDAESPPADEQSSDDTSPAEPNDDAQQDESEGSPAAGERGPDTEDTPPTGAEGQGAANDEASAEPDGEAESGEQAACPADRLRVGDRCEPRAGDEGILARCQEDPSLCADVVIGSRQDEESRTALHNEILRASCKYGHTPACVEVQRRRALGVGSRKRAKAALLELEELCTGAVPSACTEVARLLLAGGGVDRDAGKARARLEAACDARHGPGCHLLGDILLRGRWTDRDPKAAADYFARACSLGEPKGCVYLGLQRAQGIGVPRDGPAAVEFLDEACANFEDAGTCDAASTLRSQGRASPPSDFMRWMDEHYFYDSPRGWVRGSLVVGWTHLSDVTPHDRITLVPVFARLGLAVVEIEFGGLAGTMTHLEVENEHTVPVAMVGVGAAPFAFGVTMDELPWRRLIFGYLEPFATFRSYMAESEGTMQALSVGNRFTLSHREGEIAVRVGVEASYEFGVTNLSGGPMVSILTEIGWVSVWD